MAKPTPKRMGLLRMARDHSSDTIPFYPWNAGWILLSRYYLTDEDVNVIHAAVRSGLLRVHKDHFYFLTDAGRALLDKYKDLYPEIPSAPGKPRPKLKAATDRSISHE